MFDFSLGELGLIGVVALIVLGPERLPKVARQVGDWVGKAQRYVNQVKSDINREIELAELKKLQEEAQSAARSVESSLRGFEGDLARAGSEMNAALGGDGAGATSEVAAAASAGAWEPADDTWRRHTFARRYKAGPSIDELAEEIVRLKRQMALPGGPTSTRGKYAPRARMNRPRIRR